jgi:hypothetical protein
MFGLNRNVVVEFTKNKMIVDVIMNDGRTEKAVFHDHLALVNGQFQVSHSASEMFKMTKNKDRMIQRVWLTEAGYFINEKDISSFGSYENQKVNESFQMKQNIFTKKYSWA